MVGRGGQACKPWCRQRRGSRHAQGFDGVGAAPAFAGGWRLARVWPPGRARGVRQAL